VNLEAYTILAERQELYWWHRSRRFLSLGLLKKFGIKKKLRWIDIGCGPGGNLTMLKNFCPKLIVGCDLSHFSLLKAKSVTGEAKLIRMNINDSFPFSSERFDLATIFNVLYHKWVIDEKAVLDEVFRILSPGGLVLITEPAFPVLFREMDFVVMGNKRYYVKQFTDLARITGFNVRFESYFTSFGFPILLGSKFINKFRKKGEKNYSLAPDMKPISLLVNNLFFSVAQFEARLLLKGMKMPFGTTLITVLQKPDKSQ